MFLVPQLLKEEQQAFSQCPAYRGLCLIRKNWSTISSICLRRIIHIHLRILNSRLLTLQQLHHHPIPPRINLPMDSPEWTWTWVYITLLKTQLDSGPLTKLGRLSWFLKISTSFLSDLTCVHLSVVWLWKYDKNVTIHIYILIST